MRVPIRLDRNHVGQVNLDDFGGQSAPVEAQGVVARPVERHLLEVGLHLRNGLGRRSTYSRARKSTDVRMVARTVAEVG